MLTKAIGYIIQNKIVAFLVIISIVFLGLITTPFEHGLNLFTNSKVSVDAIPDIGENQQIVFTEWNGQSPQIVEDQITYPLTSYLLGLPKVKSIRSNSMFGFSSIYVIFEDGVDFYWARSRLLEKLTVIPKDLLPLGIQPKLGPDATSLGQVFWYTLEGRDSLGNVTGGWSPQYTRSIQDFYLRNALASTKGVSEVSSIGGYVKEYQIDVDPQLMRKYDVSLNEVVDGVQSSNLDIGAQTIEINKVEYFVRGLGYLESLNDIEETAIKTTDFTPIKIKDIARVKMGPAERRGILDKGGAQVVGGVVTARYGENPMEIVQNLKSKIEQISEGLPSKKLKDGRTSKLTIVPFYDRGELIKETLNTLGSAITYEILIAILVVLVLLRSLRISIVISSLMPLVVLFTFAVMRLFKVDANIVALSGIAIAIGTVVDMGIIMTENIVRHLRDKGNTKDLNKTIVLASKEVSGAIFTAGLTTILSFIPVFMLTGAEGKLFFSLAFTKTVALLGAMFLALMVIPTVTALSYVKLSPNIKSNWYLGVAMVLLGLVLGILMSPIAFILIPFGAIELIYFLQKIDGKQLTVANRLLSVSIVLILLSHYWKPLGLTSGFSANLVFVGFLAIAILVPIYYFIEKYPLVLDWVLKNKVKSLVFPLTILVLGILAMFSLQREFMPKLNEGDFMLMPTSLPHAGVTEIQETLSKLDMAVSSLPEVEFSVGKAGRVNSALDPAPLSMYENLIAIKPEFIFDKNGIPKKFKSVGDSGFLTKTGDTVPNGQNIQEEILIPDSKGEYYRNWRNHIKNRNDIWKEISKVSRLPSITASPRLQPIETRLVMLQTGMRSDLGIKVRGQDLKELEKFSFELEQILKQVEGVVPSSVFAERIVGKPYLIFDLNREKIARYGLSIQDVQETIEIAIGGKIVSESIEGRERYAVRLRYPRELRTSPEELKNVLISSPSGTIVPLEELGSIEYEIGPQSIKSEDGFLVNYVTFDRNAGISDIALVNKARKDIAEKIENGDLIIPNGINYEFSGAYENHLRSQRTLSIVIPLVLLLIFIILFVQFRSVSTALMVFSGTMVAFAGGFILLWLYGQSWFLDIGWDSNTLRNFLNIGNVNLSVAVWVGFIALFGIATDDGVVMASYLKQNFQGKSPQNIEEIRDAVILAGKKRIRPCLMTTATTILALFPILLSQGKGSEIMIPMAIPCLGGMLMALITLFVVPLLYCWRKELVLTKSLKN